MIIVSACLAGFPCRWDAAEKGDSRIIELVKAGKAIPVCPEQLGGMTTPRAPSEIGDGGVFAKDGTDVTEQFTQGAKMVLKIVQTYECKQAILKAKSPSCGSGLIYDGTFTGVLIQGDGITAKLLKENGVLVSSEEDL